MIRKHGRIWFHPADFPLQNRALTGQYPPGSIFKIIIALAALQEGVVTPDEEIFCGGSFFLGKQKYRCWKKYGHGKVNLHRALVESCDVYFYTVGKRLGIDKIAHYAKLFGMGRESGLALGNEKGGLVPTRKMENEEMGCSMAGRRNDLHLYRTEFCSRNAHSNGHPDFRGF